MLERMRDRDHAAHASDPADPVVDRRSPHAEWAPPLLSRPVYRTLVGLSLVLATGAACLLGLVVVIFSPGAWEAGIALLMLFCTPLAVRAIERCRWSRNWLRWPERAAVTLLVLIAGGIAAAGLAQAVELLAERAWSGATTLEIVFWLGAGTAALGGAFLLLAAVPLPLPRQVARWALAALAVVVSAGAVATAVVYAGPDGCDSFEVDRDRWADGARDSDHDEDRERIADAIVRCDALDGMTVAEVRAKLGREAEAKPRRGSRMRAWQAGWTNDGFGLGDEQFVELWFSGGRVSDASLRYDGAAD
jgi:hypothetical protein